MGQATYRPPQWKQNPPPQVVLITFPGQGAAAQFSSSSGVTASLPSSQTQYIFDAVILAAHEQEVRKTEHPVQSGASISDHAFILPARLVLDVGMSDAIAAYLSPSTWNGNPSKSVAAFQTMLALQFSRIPLTITTRLRTYSNMIIERLRPEETKKTFLGLRMTVEFGQIFLASIVQNPNSARPQSTQQTNLGTVNPQPPSQAQQSQNSVSGVGGVPVILSNAVGAGDWSSTNLNNLLGLP